ncbi:hypothetical protein MBLNU230_g7955t1 [Neophaeotheca triangularis]
MGFFSRRKSKQANQAPPKQEEKPVSEPYKHVPRHAGADSVVLGTNQPNRRQISFQHEMRMNSGKSEGLPTASISQMLAHPSSPQSPVARTPSPFGRQQRSPFGSPQRFQQGEVFTTDPDAPPLPSSPLLNGATPGKLPRNGSGYFSSRDLPAPARSSMRNSSQEPKGRLPRNNSGFLPELSLGDDLSEEPAFSEAAMSDYGTTTAAMSEKSQDIYSSRSENGAVAGASRSRTWSRMGSKSRKQTRFQDAAEPAPAHPPAPASVREPLPAPAPASDPATHQDFPEGPKNVRRQSQHAPEVQHPVDREAESQPNGWRPTSDPRDMHAPEVFSEDMQHQANGWGSSDPRSEQPYQLPQSEQMVSPMLGSVAPVQQPQQPPHFSRPMSPQIHSSSSSQRMTMPPLVILEGLKVNKSGRILDEEGDPIGELVEGNIVDCVRQKANANGEVLDEHGAVVGRVVTLARGAESSFPQGASPAPVMHQPHGYFQPHNIMGALWSPDAISRRRESDISVSGRQTHHAYGHANDGILAPEPQRAIPDYRNMVELDASEIVQAPPVLDHSEIFLPDFQQAKSSPRGSEKDASEGALQPAKRESPPRPPRTAVESFVVEQSKPEAPAVELQSQKPEGRKLDVPVTAEHHEQLQKGPSRPARRARPSSALQLTRSMSDNTLTTMSREPSTSRRMMTMDSVPELTAAEGLPDRSPALFSYKGNIPLTDGPGVINVHGANGKPQTQRPVSLDNQASRGPAFTPGSNPVHFGSKTPMAHQRLSQQSVQIPRPAVKSRYSTNQPLVRSPLSSHETTPPDSDKSTSDDGTTATSYITSSRPPSVRTNYSTASASKPRTYFTHAGRVVVDSGREEPLSRTASRSSSTPAASARSSVVGGERPTVEGQGKKKSRFSFSLGRRDRDKGVVS